MKVLITLLGTAAALSASAGQAESPGVGAALFKRSCAICHTDVEGGGNKLGPNLYGVFGRKAGGVAGYNYSPAMASSGLSWTADNLDRYLGKPSTVVPGNRMGFPGLSAPGNRAAIIAYLKSLKR